MAASLPTPGSSVMVQSLGAASAAEVPSASVSAARAVRKQAGEGMEILTDGFRTFFFAGYLLPLHEARITPVGARARRRYERPIASASRAAAASSFCFV